MDKFGIIHKLRQAESVAGDVRRLRHSYVILYENTSYRINPCSAPNIGWGFDYYLEVLRLIEQTYDGGELTFLLSNDCPERVPQYGPSVVLLVLCDESYKYYSYFQNLRCIFKCYTLKPELVFPSVGLNGKVGALLQFLKKSSTSTISRIATAIHAQRCGKQFPRIYPLPLGYFAKPSLQRVKKDIGFVFAGSVEYGTDGKFRIDNLVPPPKLASRRLMAQAATEYLKRYPQSGVLCSTDGFLASVADPGNYWSLLSRAKVALCPRGGVAETYRFFEAALAGCVIISEALPRAWYYEDHPAIIIRNWSKLGCVLTELLSDDNKLGELSSRSTKYWNSRTKESVVADYIMRRLD